MLKLENLSAGYGTIQVLRDISLHVPEGKIVTLIGANGAGKSTTLRAASGLIKVSSGNVIFKNKSITNMPASNIVATGLIHVPEGRHIFSELTIKENLEMGAYLRKDKDGIQSDLEECYDMFPILKERHTQRGGSLSGGEQQMLAIARGLMARPSCLLLDEPSLGLAPILVEKVFETILKINKKGMTIFLIEQNANMALQIAHQGYVMRTGEIVMQDTGDNLLANDEIQKMYLGG